jgi:hypothetical protein
VQSHWQAPADCRSAGGTVISKLGSNYSLLLVLPPVIGNYWLLLAIIAIIFLQKVLQYWLLLHHVQTLIIAIIAYLLLQLIVSA